MNYDSENSVIDLVNRVMDQSDHITNLKMTNIYNEHNLEKDRLVKSWSERYLVVYDDIIRALSMDVTADEIAKLRVKYNTVKKS